MENYIENKLEKAIIVAINDSFDDNIFSYRIHEIMNLATAANFEIVNTIIQNLEHPNSKTFVGRGKLAEILQEIKALEIENVIFEDELSPAQIKNIEEYLNCTIIDRTMLILTIFETRAKTKEAALQVHIAKLQYMLPRLVGTRNYLSRTGGGGGGGLGARRGGGETKLELDHRYIEKQITKAKEELAVVIKNRVQNRKLRKSNNTKVVAFVGYTNAGKSSTINNLLTKFQNEEKQVFVKNMLFATLDTSTRRIKMDNNHEFLITDTVGFVSNLPHHLIESFKSTLEEIKDADLIIHIIDASSPFMELQIDTTLKVLKDLGVSDIPIVNAYNKTDLVTDYFIQKIDDKDSIFISAKNSSGFDDLIKTIEENLFHHEQTVTLIIPYDKGEIVHHLMNVAIILSTEYLENGTKITATVSDYIYNLYLNYLI